MPLKPVRVWDLPTRLFHWALALCVCGSIISAKIGGNAMAWHFRLGYVVFALLAFRLLWGVFGGRWSRFASFIYSPLTLWRYVRGQSQPHAHLDVGHNPLGSLSVFAVLAVLAVQVASGLVADDEIANVGPLNRLASAAWVSTATSWHKTWGQWLILALLGLHVLAIGVYTLRKKGLVRPMVVGDKNLDAATPASADGAAQRAWALVLMALCAAGVTWLVRFGAAA
jgi:cytochrome b